MPSTIQTHPPSSHSSPNYRQLTTVKRMLNTAVDVYMLFIYSRLIAAAMTWFSLEDQQSCSYHCFIWTYKIKTTLNDYLFVVTTRLLQKRPRGLTWDAMNWISKGHPAASVYQTITNIIVCCTGSLLWWTEAIQCFLPLLCKKIYVFLCETNIIFYCICTWLCICPLLLLIVML